MGLQVRLVHALADRVMELEPRAGGGPLVVGRATEADIHIPSLNVSRRHAMLHFRDGGWILQDAGGGRGTFVNGKPITGAVQLKSGDVVTLGTDPTPATLVIDPYGEAGPARPVAAAETPPSTRRRGAAASGSAPPQPTAAAPSRAASRPVAPPVAPPIDTGDPFAAEPAGVEAGDSIEVGAEWMAAAPAASEASSPSPKRRRKDQMSGGMKAATALLTIVIIGGAVWLAVKRSREADKAALAQAPATKPAPAARKVTPPVAVDKGEPTPVATTTGGTPPAVASAGSTEPPAPSTPTGPNFKASIDLPPELGSAKTPTKSAAQAEMEAELNPDAVKPSAAAADKYWAGVEEAHNISEPVTAVVIYEDYLKLFPDGKHVSEVNQFMEDALDQLWWQRIADLMKKQQDVQKDINKKDAEIAAETSTEFKEKLNGEKADLTKEFEKAGNELKEMKYELQDPPNTHDPAALKLLRQARDAHVYDIWKQAIHLRIKTSRGAKVF